MTEGHCSYNEAVDCPENLSCMACAAEDVNSGALGTH